ncbi:ABC transporter permease [Halolactibacillus alkaliphilus]|uniref:ABC transporter permease n=1 Tax=Halolactibacillus alkaliphilus TaxID=442899 RepID=A0A511X2C6_9BACI|nr:sugar ABC transporter permease [Halolactibacillus alkaliphilus]GEN57083.1 ABC transporter permease [Halolactibacillus alkaliphilus]GGN71852.1 ABC transporter permease [Halolactibacillus alkaliphilus]SFO87037.1 raffinose/stachyose/melibiose transport system permease protein [Halolactibacillus alkaliphilus]
MDKVMSNKKVIALYVLPSLILLAGLVYIPIILTGYYGLMDWNGIGPMTFIGLENYIKLLSDATFWYSARNSFFLAFFSSAALIVYLAVSLVLAAKIKGRETLRKIYLIPMLLSSVAIAQLWIKIYDPNNGMLNSLLKTLGVESPPAWLAQRETVLIAIFIAIVWQYAGFYIIIYSAALKGIPSSLIEAAEIDGATPLQIAYKIKLPLISGVIKTTIVLAIVGSLKYFDLIYVMTGGGPNGSSEVIASYMYKQAFGINNFGYGSAIGFMLLLLALTTTFIIQKITASKNDNLQY